MGKQENCRTFNSYFTFWANTTSTYSLPSCSPAFPCYPPPRSQGPAEPAAASFCAVGVWCPAPAHIHNATNVVINIIILIVRVDGVSTIFPPLCHPCSPSRGPAGRPAGGSDPRRSTHEPCSRTGRGPAPGASRTPVPLSSVQMEHQHHCKKRE